MSRVVSGGDFGLFHVRWAVLEDGEVIGLDGDGCVICWDAENGMPYNCGDTPEEFGEMTEVERRRLEVPFEV